TVQTTRTRKPIRRSTPKILSFICEPVELPAQLYCGTALTSITFSPRSLVMYFQLIDRSRGTKSNETFIGRPYHHATFGDCGCFANGAGQTGGSCCDAREVASAANQRRSEKRD